MTDLTITIEQIDAALVDAGLRPTAEVFSLLGQEIQAWGRDDEETWHDWHSAMKVTGFWSGDVADLAEAEDRFYAAAGLFACECPCDCWLTDNSVDGCDCAGCAGPHYRDVKLLVLPIVTIRLVPWTAVFRAMHWGPWASEFFAALDKSGLMNKLLVSIVGDAPAPVTVLDDGTVVEPVHSTMREWAERNGPIVVDPEPLTGSPVAFVEEGGLR